MANLCTCYDISYYYISPLRDVSSKNGAVGILMETSPSFIFPVVKHRVRVSGNTINN